MTLRQAQGPDRQAQGPDRQAQGSGPAHRSIKLIYDKCTSCMICVRECPAWCIALSSHAEPIPGSPPGPRQRTHNILDAFSIDWSLCLYCGICIEVCPFDALHWSPAYSYAAPTILELTHERPDLDETRPR